MGGGSANGLTHRREICWTKIDTTDLTFVSQSDTFQMINYRAFFDQNLELVGYENITIVGSLSVVAPLSTRFTSIVHNYNVR